MDDIGPSEWLSDGAFDRCLVTIWEFLDEHPTASYGPAHVIIDDWNFEVDLIDEVLSNCDEPTAQLLQRLREIVLPEWRQETP